MRGFRNKKIAFIAGGLVAATMVGGGILAATSSSANASSEVGIVQSR